MTLDLATELRDNGGFTYDPRTEELVRIGSKDGYAIAIPGTECVILPGASVIAGVEQLAREYALDDPNLYIGGWHSEERGVDIIELTEILDIGRLGAVLLGQERNQEGILDMRTGEFIPTGGTGG